MKSSFALVAILGLLTVASASGTVIFTAANDPQADEENVLFNTSGLIPGPALTVTGTTQTTLSIVSFTSNENLITPTGGQALVAAEDGDFSVLTISLTNAYFKDLIFNLNTVSASDSGTATITAHLEGGVDPAPFTMAIGNGSNFGTLLADGSEKILSVDISSTVQLQDIRQTRVSGAASLGGPVDLPAPEPTTFVLVAGALIGLGTIGRRRR
jgi:hypothetical protein